jgi:Protein of unknown function (DUF3168)
MDASVVIPAVVGVLTADPVVVASLRPYRSLPGVFRRQAQGDAALPYAVVRHVAERRDDTHDTPGKEHTVDVAFYGREQDGDAPVDELAEHAERLLHRGASALALARGRCAGCWSGGVGPGPDEPGVVSRGFSLRILTRGR